MNNSLDRLLDGIVAVLRSDVLPRLDDDYAAGQTLAAIDLLNNLKPRLDWAVLPLLERALAQRELLAELDGLLADWPDRPRLGESLASLPADGAGLLALCDRMDGFIGTLVRCLDEHGSVDAHVEQTTIVAAKLAISVHLSGALRRDMALTQRPLFAEISRGRPDTGSRSDSSRPASTK